MASIHMTLKDRKSLRYLANFPFGSFLPLTKRKYSKIPPTILKIMAIIAHIPMLAEPADMLLSNV